MYNLLNLSNVYLSDKTRKIFIKQHEQQKSSLKTSWDMFTTVLNHISFTDTF